MRSVHELRVREDAGESPGLGRDEFSLQADGLPVVAALLETQKHPLPEVHPVPALEHTLVRKPALGVRVAEVVLVLRAPPGLNQVAVDPGRVPVHGLARVRSRGGQDQPGRPLAAAAEAAGEVHDVVVAPEDHHIDAPGRRPLAQHGGLSLVPVERQAIDADRRRFRVVGVVDEESFGARPSGSRLLTPRRGLGQGATGGRTGDEPRADLPDEAAS